MQRSYKKIDKLLQQTATSLNLDEATVSQVLNHNFSSLSGFLAQPSHGAYRLPYFGLFYAKPNFIRACIKRMIRSLRSKETKSLRREMIRKDLHYAFTNRHRLTAYAYSRQFKKVYGSWHYK